MHADIIIIGAGIAGASLGWALRQQGADVLLLEAEDRPGYHTTGRSAAFWVESYGGPAIAPLSRASRPFLDAPPPGFGPLLTPLLTPRPALHLAPPDAPHAPHALAAIESELTACNTPHQHLSAADLAHLTLLKPHWRTAGILEPDCHDIDVAALHQGYLRGARLLTGTRIQHATRQNGLWQLNGEHSAPLVVNAAGAWADAVGALFGAAPKGLTPLRRTMAVLRLDPAPPPDLPVIMDALGRFYFKPDSGRLWLSPHDETPDVPHDVRPDELDLATVIDRFEQLSTARVVALEHSWAGLRTFAPDRHLVLGPDAQVEGLHWCAGQGGYGIQTAPAVATLCTQLITGQGSAGPHAASRFG
jgi:D-arginine dehydrogenase